LTAEIPLPPIGRRIGVGAPPVSRGAPREAGGGVKLGSNQTALLGSFHPAPTPTTKMPRTYAALRAKWEDPKIIEPNRKMLAFFGNPNKSGSEKDGVADSWLKVKD
jgi:hypothetical protein